MGPANSEFMLLVCATSLCASTESIGSTLGSVICPNKLLTPHAPASEQRVPGQILQEGTGYKELIIGPNWEWIETYVNLEFHAVISGERYRPYETASGMVL